MGYAIKKVITFNASSIMAFAGNDYTMTIHSLVNILSKDSWFIIRLLKLLPRKKEKICRLITYHKIYFVAYLLAYATKFRVNFLAVMSCEKPQSYVNMMIDFLFAHFCDKKNYISLIRSVV